VERVQIGLHGCEKNEEGRTASDAGAVGDDRPDAAGEAAAIGVGGAAQSALDEEEDGADDAAD
jgi:hypothetical protein